MKDREDQKFPISSGNNAKEVLNLKEACVYAGISSSQMYKLTCSKAIQFYRPNGKLIYFKRQDLLDWLLRNKSSAKGSI